VNSIDDDGAGRPPVYCLRSGGTCSFDGSAVAHGDP
jgi:hypothetical protein